jgi:phage baseplate assembly protein W
MAVIDLNNIVRPQKLYDPKAKVTDVVSTGGPTYVDLHLDLKEALNVGLGDVSINSGDILIDYDVQAIKNSIRNIFTTKKGQKILNPDFGCSLEQYLFTQITESNAKAIGSEILRGITKYESRINVKNIYVIPSIDRNSYNISVYYTLLEINKQSIINMIALVGGQLSIE